MFDRMMVAFDGTEISRRALHAGIDLAKRLERPLRTITVLETSPIFLAAGGAEPATVGDFRRAAEAFAQELHEEARRLAEAAGVPIECEAVHGDEVEGILDAVARHRVDTLIVGIRAHPGLVDRLVSRTAQNLTERSPCSVIGVK